jgi:flagellar biosynthesis protein FliP
MKSGAAITPLHFFIPFLIIDIWGKTILMQMITIGPPGEPDGPIMVYRVTAN